MQFNQGNKRQQRGKGIVHVSSLFDKYRKTLTAPQGTVISECVRAISKELGVDLDPHVCRYSVATRTLTLKVSGMVKTEILMRKDEILSTVAEVIGKENAPKSIV